MKSLIMSIDKKRNKGERISQSEPVDKIKYESQNRIIAESGEFPLGKIAKLCNPKHDIGTRLI